MNYPFLKRTGQWLWANLGLVMGLALLMSLRPVIAHHGGSDIHTFNGLWEGIRHPFMELDHLVLVISAGLLAARKHGSLVWTFAGTSLGGIGVAMMGIRLPSVFVVAIALFAVGLLLIQSHRASNGLMWSGAAIAGFCHGHPHGAALATVAPSAQVTFLLSFILVQLVIGYMSCGVTRRFLNPQQRNPLMLAGLGICGVGIAYLSAAVLQ